MVSFLIISGFAVTRSNRQHICNLCAWAAEVAASAAVHGLCTKFARPSFKPIGFYSSRAHGGEQSDAFVSINYFVQKVRNLLGGRVNVVGDVGETVEVRASKFFVECAFPTHGMGTGSPFCLQCLFCVVVVF